MADDDPFVRVACRNEFARQMDVAEAADGAEALLLLEKHPFDYVLCDHRMPGADGIEVLAFAMERQPAARRFLMSACLDPSIIRAAQGRARVDACFDKPFHDAEIPLLFLRLALEMQAHGDREPSNSAPLVRAA